MAGEPGAVTAAAILLTPADVAAATAEARTLDYEEVIESIRSAH
jgi:hypothetical protein